MVTISGYVLRESGDGKQFYSLVIQGGLEMVLSEESGRYYATAKQASITSTFDEATCLALVGTKLPGRVTKVVCGPYEHVTKETGEILQLQHRWTYSPNEVAVDEMVYEKAGGGYTGPG